MWMGAIPRTYGLENEPKTPMGPAPEMGFGGGPGPVGKPRRGSRGEMEPRGEEDAERDAQASARDRELRERGSAGRQGGGGCHHHAPFVGELLPGTLRMKRGVAAMTAMIPLDGDDDDADLADDVCAFIRRTPLPWTQSRLMQVALVEFGGVNREILRATMAGVLAGMKKAAQHILMASIRNGNPHRGGRAAAIYLDADTVDIYI